MNYRDETEFENHLRDLIRNNICQDNENIIVLDSQNVADIIICKNGNNKGIYFLEVKHLKPSMNRLGVGGAIGKGFQPEILIKEIDYFEDNLLWVLYSEIHENSNIIVINSEKLRSDYAQGDSIGFKYNGIKQSVFDSEASLSDIEFIGFLKQWLNI